MSPAFSQPAMDKAVADLRRLVNSFPLGRTDQDRIFFDGRTFHRDPASGDWLPVARP